MSRRRLRIGTVVVAGSLLLLSACGSDDGTGASGSDPGLEHVHGLGIDPADGTLYAASHLGLFRVPEHGRASRVADRYQDTMGFTVVGPRHFLASGHPDLQESDLPPLLGLIESADAGRSWDPVSLLGTADFHALVSRHGMVYGYDATSRQFMVSRDGRAWDTRSQPDQIISFAVDPASADHVLAATTSGLQLSTDGGRGWDPVGSPALVFLSWADDGTLLGVTPAGRVYTSTDRGMTWARSGDLRGRPEALLAVDREHAFAAVEGARISESTDGGSTWRARYRQNGSANGEHTSD